jgi:hypothetical protein
MCQLKINLIKLDMVVHAWNPTYSGDGDQEDHSLRPAWALNYDE